MHTPPPPPQRLLLNLLMVATTILLCPICAQGDPKNPSPAELTTMEKECLAAETVEQCRNAIPICEQFQSATEKEPNKGKQQISLAKIEVHMLDCEYLLGRYESGERHGRQGLERLQRIFGEDHFDVAEVLSGLTELFRIQGRYAEAEQLGQRSLQIMEKTPNSNDQIIAGTANNLGLVYQDLAKYAPAARMFLRALQIWERTLGDNHPHVAIAINNLALVYDAQGRYQDAEILFRRSLRIWTETLGPEHQNVATGLNNLARLLYNEARYREAEPLFQRCVRIFEKILGRDHPKVSAALNQLSQLYRAQERYKDAEIASQRSVNIAEKSLPQEHPDIAAALYGLASVYLHTALYEKAELLFQRCLRIWKFSFGAEHPLVAVGLHSLARLYSEQGRTKDTIGLLLLSLSILEKAYGMNHPDIASILSKLAQVYIASSRLGAAFVTLERVAHIRDDELRSSPGEIRSHAKLTNRRIEEELIYGLLLLDQYAPTVQRLALRTMLLFKGRTASAGETLNRLLNTLPLDPLVRARFEEWRSVREQREALIYRGNRRPEEYQTQLKDLQIQADSLEAQLAQSIPEIRTLQPPKFDDIIPEVAKRIPKDGVLVEVVWTRPYQVKAKDEASRWGAPHYVALLLYPDQRIASVDLGLASELDEKGRELLAVLRAPQSDPKPAAQAMYQKLFAPLLPQLAGKKEVFLSLDGSLHLIPFAALHDGSDYLLGQYHFHYLTSGRDLLREPSKRTPSAALVLANPDFGPIEPATTPAQSAPTMSIYQRLATLTPLPAAQVEAEQIAALLGVKPLLGSAAREEVIHDAHAPWILHLATHGLFLGDVELPVVDERTRSSLLALLPPPAPQPATPNTEQLPGEINAMNRSTLVLAGVRQGQRASSLKQDGLLTAENSRSLDLDGTQLVVLSACDSAVGTTSTGQGIYGLRRGFLVAGAETVITSLWRLDDQATGELMVQYYRKLLDPKNPGDRLRAMEESMQGLRSHRAHPYYWAPFLVIGQDGPLRRP